MKVLKEDIISSPPYESLSVIYDMEDENEVKNNQKKIRINWALSISSSVANPNQKANIKIKFNNNIIYSNTTDNVFSIGIVNKEIYIPMLIGNDTPINIEVQSFLGTSTFNFSLKPIANTKYKINNIWKTAFAWIKTIFGWKRCLIWRKINGVWKRGK